MRCKLRNGHYMKTKTKLTIPHCIYRKIMTKTASGTRLNNRHMKIWMCQRVFTQKTVEFERSNFLLQVSHKMLMHCWVVKIIKLDGFLQLDIF